VLGRVLEIKHIGELVDSGISDKLRFLNVFDEKLMDTFFGQSLMSFVK